MNEAENENRMNVEYQNVEEESKLTNNTVF